MEVTYDEALRIADRNVREQAYDPRLVARPLQVVYLVGQLEFEIATGGVLQWLTNSSGRYAVETVAALEDIGANECASIVRQALDVFSGGKPPEADEARVAVIQKVLPTAESTWRELGERLLDWPDDVDALLRKYVQSHASHFVPG